MNRTIQSIRMAGLAALVAGAAGCHGLLDVESPGQIADADLNTPAAVPGIVAGMANRLSNAMATIGGNMVIYPALVSGEMFHGGSYTWDEDPIGYTTPDDNYIGSSSDRSFPCWFNNKFHFCCSFFKYGYDYITSALY